MPASDAPLRPATPPSRSRPLLSPRVPLDDALAIVGCCAMSADSIERWCDGSPHRSRDSDASEGVGTRGC